MKPAKFAPLLLAAAGLYGQQNQPVLVTPDCVFYFRLTSAGRVPGTPVPGYDNRFNGCVTWTVTYFSTGFTGLNLELDSAPDAGATPGAWVAFAGAIQTGVNPNVSTTQAFTTVLGYNPWVSVNLGGLVGAGAVVGFAYGYRVPSVVYNVSGGVAANVSIVAPVGQTTMSASIPVVIASDQKWQFCNQQASFNLSGSGSTQIVALSGKTVIYVCHISLSTGSSEDVKLVEGTGVNCAGAPADLTGLYKGITTMALDFGPFAPLVTTAANALCVNQSVAQATGGTVLYRQQ